MWSALTRQLVTAACEEDLGPHGDLTAALLGADEVPVIARVVARSAGTICGLTLGPLIAETFGARLGANLRFAPATPGAGQTLNDGSAVSAGQTVATLSGPRAAVLATERTLLNFIGRLSGVASLTWRYVAAARAGCATVQVLDTRKTIPGWRELDKYAVRCGGGTNHRAGLYDAVLIKDNHLAGIPVARLAVELTRWLARAAELPVRPAFVEVEVDTLEQLAEVCRVPGVDVVLLDNFTPAQLRAAVALRAARQTVVARSVPGEGRPPLEVGGVRPLLEASGGVTLESIGEFAATGVDRISVGVLTHSAPALDVALEL
jgi:nicotinate-nucleotide pyrophosphorylase (carboxylating)